VSSHDTINCTTVDGAGAGHRWILTIDGQDSTAPTTKCVPVLCERAQERASGRGAATRHQPRAKRAQTRASGRGAATRHQPRAKRAQTSASGRGAATGHQPT
jgi:hypothetical protein